MGERAAAPRATYRFQLNAEFPFAEAERRVPYVARLGVSHLYLSPILMARRGSTHGYDTVDHTRINPELGTRADFEQLVASARKHGLGIVLDFVPNHMGVGGDQNGLWLDLLENGRDSAYADWFDVDWNSASGSRIVVPFLGDDYRAALSAGEIRLVVEDDGALAVRAHGEHRLPLRPEDAKALLAEHGSAEAAVEALNGTPGEARSWSALEALIGRQNWRLVHHAAAGDTLNYRRFFVNSDLGGIRIERDDVFEHAHRLIFELVEAGLVDGLRIDHVDGLRDPGGYATMLASKVPKPVYLLIEKILAPHERVREDWPVDGTTGYEFGALLTRLLNPAESEEAVSQAYEDFVGTVVPPHEETYRAKLGIMDNELAVELDRLARDATAILSARPQPRDYPRAAVRRVLREIIAWLEVYRTYIGDDGEIDPRDEEELDRAIAEARVRAPKLRRDLFEDVARLIKGQGEAGDEREKIADLVARIQQYTGPAMAKGLEDTALYRYNRLVSLSEVGAHPDRWSIEAAEFHEANRERLEREPDAMLTTSTHDTKRGEDTRARIGGIADAPELWADALADLHSALGAEAEGIDRNDLYVLFQLVLGAWPFEGAPGPDFADRIKGAMEKSVREARLRSDWTVPNTDYETKLMALVDSALADGPFRARFAELERALAPAGRRKSLTQAILKLTVPGVPDIYRGAEAAEQSLVDPDNRRHLDFNDLAARLEAIDGKPVIALGDDDLKLGVTRALLALRKAHPALIARGAYRALDLSKGWVGFLREDAGAKLMVLARIAPGAGHLPEGFALPEGAWTNLLDGGKPARTLEDTIKSLNRFGASVFLAGV